MSRFEGHTPGPWAQAHRESADLMCHTEVFSAADPTYVIATVAWCPVNLGGGLTISARESNARLIAAAPELAAENEELLRQRDELAEVLRGLIKQNIVGIYDYHHRPLNKEFIAVRRDRFDTARAYLAKIEADS